ncbi:MAG: hypothetical protein FJ276_01450 [Planctomycetes bacterium]|jgi:high-affinity Fe2+/Pb2+ permease|nr:hypothetical protein [Planctomycetota bacterium]
MPKALCITGMTIAVLILGLFLLDLAAAFPFNRFNIWMDVAFVLCAVGLGYLSWSTFREQD